MTDDNWYQDSEDDGRTYREDESFGANGGYAQPKPGMSTGVKVLIGVLIAGGMMALVCCGGVAFFGFKFAQMTTDDPAQIQAIQEGIAEINIPEGFSPQAGVDAEMFGVGMQMAIYQDGDSMLMLMQMKGPAGMNAAQMQQQFEQQLEQQGQNRRIDVESTEQREVTIAGEDTTIEIVKGKDRQGNEMRQVMGAFQGKGGAAFIQVIVPEEDWDEDRIIEIIESIQTGAVVENETNDAEAVEENNDEEATAEDAQADELPAE